MKKIIFVILLGLLLTGCDEVVDEKDPSENIVQNQDKEKEELEKKAEEEKRKAEEEKGKAEEEKQKAEEEKQKAEEEKRKEDETKTLTIENSEDFKFLLDNAQNDYEFAASFAEKYKGREIEFDGSVYVLANHGKYNTRYDLLVAAVDFNPDKAGNGPSFKFENITIANFVGDGEGLEYVSVGDNVKIKATVDSFNANTGLFFIRPISANAR